jgi:hypothetical protein
MTCLGTKRWIRDFKMVYNCTKVILLRLTSLCSYLNKKVKIAYYPDGRQSKSQFIKLKYSLAWH